MNMTVIWKMLNLQLMRLVIDFQEARRSATNEKIARKIKEHSKVTCFNVLETVQGALY